MQEKYSIGEVAAMLEVSTRTLRFYDEKGLVKPAYTEENGYRFYEKEQIRQIELILFLKDLGFSLKQIKTLIQDERVSKSLELLLKQRIDCKAKTDRTFTKNRCFICRINQFF